MAITAKKVFGALNKKIDTVDKKLDDAIVGIYTPGGSYEFDELPALSADTLGKVYVVTDDFTTTSDFVEGAGVDYPAGTNVAVVNRGTDANPVYKYDATTGAILVDPVPTADSPNAVSSGGTYTALAGKADKVSSATAGHLAGLDANGNLTDSGVSPTEDVTIEGNPVTFESPFEQDAKSVVVSVKPIQAGSGTPSPENIRPISGIDEVEIGVSDGESEPTTTTIPLPSTLYDADVDVTNGDADNRFGMVDMGDLDYTYNENGFFYATPPTNLKGVIFGDEVPNWISDIYKAVPYNDFVNVYNSGTMTYGGDYCRFANSAYTDATAFKAAMRGHQLCYELATPTTLSFDPTDVELLEGTNVVSTNAEKVAVTYGRSLWQDIDDLKTDTEGKLDKSNVADVEGDTASRPYAVNEFMLRSDGLYKVTQPIAQNASITASNTTKTTIGAVLTALLNA